MGDEERDAFFREFGSLEEIRKYKQSVDELLEEKRQREWLMSKIKKIISWTTIIAGIWFALKGVAGDLKSLISQFLTR